MFSLFPDTIQLDFDDDMDQIANYLTQKKYFENIFDRNTPRCIHIDIGVSGDRLGIAASYVSGWRERINRDNTTFDEIKESVPDITTEWCLGIEPRPGKRVPLYKVRVFIQWLQRQKYLIQKISCDGYQSEDMLQLLSKMGFEAELLSMDRNAIPYTTVRNWIYEGRAVIPRSNLLVREFEELEVSTDGNKVDHPDRNKDGTYGSKDVADAVGGSVFNAIANSNKIKHLTLVSASQLPMGTELAKIFWGQNK